MLISTAGGNQRGAKKARCVVINGLSLRGSCSPCISPSSSTAAGPEMQGFAAQITPEELVRHRCVRPDLVACELIFVALATPHRPGAA